MIPASLCLVALATAFGPWGAYQVSERSQTERLADLLIRNGILVDGRVTPASAPLDFEDRKEISAVLDYLFETHGSGSIADWFGGEMATIDTVPGGRATAPRETPARTLAVMDNLGVEYVDRWQAEQPESFSYFLVQDTGVLRTAGFDYAFKVNRYSSHAVTLDDAEYLPAYDSADVAIVVMRPDSTPVVTLPLADLIEEGRALPREGGGTRIEDPALLMVEAETPQARARAYFTNLSGRLVEEGPVLDSFDATVYITIEPPPPE